MSKPGSLGPRERLLRTSAKRAAVGNPLRTRGLGRNPGSLCHLRRTYFDLAPRVPPAHDLVATGSSLGHQQEEGLRLVTRGKVIARAERFPTPTDRPIRRLAANRIVSGPSALGARPPIMVHPANTGPRPPARGSGAARWQSLLFGRKSLTIRRFRILGAGPDGSGLDSPPGYERSAPNLCSKASSRSKITLSPPSVWRSSRSKMASVSLRVFSARASAARL